MIVYDSSLDTYVVFLAPCSTMWRGSAPGGQRQHRLQLHHAPARHVDGVLENAILESETRVMLRLRVAPSALRKQLCTDGFRVDRDEVKGGQHLAVIFRDA